MTSRLAGMLALLGTVTATGLATAQTPTRVSVEKPTPSVTLSLQEALGRARASSPTYRQVLNDAGPAKVAVRNAYGQFVPTLDVSGSLGYVGSGKSTFGGSTFNQFSPSLTSGYGVQVGMQISGATVLGPGTQKANQRAVEEDITGAGIALNNEVTTQYLSVLQASATTDVARQQVIRNTEFLQLAEARRAVGQATLLEVRQAEVTRGQSEVQLLQAIQQENEAKLELLRRIGVELPVAPSELALSDSFALSEPTFQLEQLLQMAEEENPVLRSAKAREDAARWNAKSARSQYLPSLNLQAAWQGYTQEFTDTELLLSGQVAGAKAGAASCNFQNALIGELPGGAVPGYPNGGIVPDCNTFNGLNTAGDALLPELESALRDRNNVFPFRFENQPFRANLQISVPIFSGFNRNLQVARANAAREDAEETVRARELQVRTDVKGRFLALQAAWQAIGVQAANQTAAREQLQLAEERFRLGSGSALEVTDAQTAVTRAEADYVNAIYAYHKAIAALEYAVGRPLR